MRIKEGSSRPGQCKHASVFFPPKLGRCHVVIFFFQNFSIILSFSIMAALTVAQLQVNVLVLITYCFYGNNMHSDLYGSHAMQKDDLKKSFIWWSFLQDVYLTPRLLKESPVPAHCKFFFWVYSLWVFLCLVNSFMRENKERAGMLMSVYSSYNKRYDG